MVPPTPPYHNPRALEHRSNARLRSKNSKQAVKNLINRLARIRNRNGNATASIRGTLGINHPNWTPKSNDPRMVNSGIFTIRKINNRNVLEFVPNSRNNGRPNMRFIVNGNNVFTTFKHPNMNQYSQNWSRMTEENFANYPNIVTRRINF